jgi:hypothetical protein
MDFEFMVAHNSPNNTTISGQHMTYVITTPFFSRTTLVERDGALVAEIERHLVRNTIVRIGGQEHTLSEFVKNVGIIRT